MDIDDRFKGISVFMQAANASSFTLAAERLGLTTSAVGKSVARLEERLGVRLFHRTTRRINLTEDGQAFLDSCMRAISELDAAQVALASRLVAPAGRLRVDLPVVFGRQYVMPALFELTKRFPALELDDSFNNRSVDLLDEGVDLVVRIGELGDSAHLAARPLMQQRLVVCGSATYLHKRGVPASLDDLASHECVTHGRGGIETPWVFADREGTPEARRVRGHLQFGNVDVIADAVRLGRGLAQLPTWLIADELRSGELIEVLGDYAGDGAPVHAVWPKTRHLAPKVRVAIDQLAHHFANVTP